jgi:release factor glutamine methyltransferase
MTVLEAIQKSREFLEKNGVDSARLEAEHLLGHVLKLPRLQLYLQFDRVLAEPETAALREFVRRRASREPLQHILGTACFCGLDIKVSRDVLVPRPETEQLAEHGWRFLNSLGRPARFLDFGTGSGCISIALCRFAPAASGIALDISEPALNLARQNAEGLGVSERLRFRCSNAFAATDPASRFDLIISNPPYIPAGDIGGLQEEVRNHDPRAALDGGSDGLDFYRLLASRAGDYLLPGGKLMCEFGDAQESAVAALLEQQGWTAASIQKDFSGRARFFIAARA